MLADITNVTGISRMITALWKKTGTQNYQKNNNSNWQIPTYDLKKTFLVLHQKLLGHIIKLYNTESILLQRA